jgi:hypothetical protein
VLAWAHLRAIWRIHSYFFVAFTNIFTFMYLIDTERPHSPRILFPRQLAGGATISRKSIEKAFFAAL